MINIPRTPLRKIVHGRTRIVRLPQHYERKPLTRKTIRKLANLLKCQRCYTITTSLESTHRLCEACRQKEPAEK